MFLFSFIYFLYADLNISDRRWSISWISTRELWYRCSLKKERWLLLFMYKSSWIP